MTTVVKKNLSAKKRIRQAEKRTARNRAVISRIKTLAKHLDASLASGNPDDVNEKLRTVVGAINRAASKGILHRNTASRKVSRLNKLVNRTLAGNAG